MRSRRWRVVRSRERSGCSSAGSAGREPGTSTALVLGWNWTVGRKHGLGKRAVVTATVVVEWMTTMDDARVNGGELCAGFVG